ncbi:MAG: ATP-binding protein [Pseudonocardiaceae bacterium]
MLVVRSGAPRLEELLRTFRIVLLGGARQTGKTTLVRDLLDLPATSWFSLDDEATLRRATDDPVGFIEALPRPAAIDEFQRAGPGLLLAAKQAADQDRTRGRLLLTGSASYLADRSVSETLAGRAGRLTLWPFSEGERRGVHETFIERLFDASAWPSAFPETPSRPELVERLLRGAYPEIITEALPARARRDWFEAYVRDVVSREALRPMAEVRLESDLRRVLRLLAARSCAELVIADLARDAELSRETTANYVALLEALYLVTLIPPWATTRAKRRPKITLVDTGLAADLVGAGEATFAPSADGVLAGALFETLVVTEVLKQASWSQRSVEVSHFRDRDGAEIDLVVEDRRSAAVAGIEVKLTSTPLARHARHLARMRERLGARFSVGLVVHAGRVTLPLGAGIWAVPISALWRHDQ